MGHQYDDATQHATTQTREENRKWAGVHEACARQRRQEADAAAEAAQEWAAHPNCVHLQALADRAADEAEHHDERARAYHHAANRQDPEDDRARNEAITSLRTLETWCELTGRTEAAILARATATTLEAEDTAEQDAATDADHAPGETPAADNPDPFACPDPITL